MEVIKEVFQSLDQKSPLSIKGSPQEIRLHLTQIFSKILKTNDFISMAETIYWDQTFPSHVKASLFEETYNQKVLKLDLICFKNQVPTHLHTHPEILVEEILQGSLLEKIYSAEPTGYHLNQELVRPKGHHRSLYDPEGHPHIVQSISKNCLSLCLSYGTPTPSLPIKENL